ncbi:MAG TPA: class I SAM-dependent methyltransferase [Candidatus Angelobacter sp.]|nr:class I SAM-dependent methyltransferase [Candidatus Angelobacter sp.]
MITDKNEQIPARLAPHRPLTEFYPTAAQRARYVGDLFDRAAGDYDWMSGAMSWGTDRRYRRSALRQAGLRPGLRVLDVATGTGLVAQAALDLGIPADDLTGLDPSRGMLSENQRRHAYQLMQGIGEALPFRNETFDFISMGYALRHVEDLGRLFAEFHRVLSEKGRVLILEITRPLSRAGFGLMRFYMRRLMPLLTRLGTRHRDSARLMEYYWATIAECVPPASILSALSCAGFVDVARRTTGRVLSEYQGTKK